LVLLQVCSDFEEQYADGIVEGLDNELIPSQHTVIDLDYYSTVEELVDVGPEKLKEVMTILLHVNILFEAYSPNHMFFVCHSGIGGIRTEGWWYSAAACRETFPDKGFYTCYIISYFFKFRLMRGYFYQLVAAFLLFLLGLEGTFSCYET